MKEKLKAQVLSFCHSSNLKQNGGRAGCSSYYRKKGSCFSGNWVSRIEVSVRFPQGFKTSRPGCGSQWKRKAREKPSSSLWVYSLFLFIWGLIILFLFVGSFVQNQFNLIYIEWPMHSMAFPLPAFSTSFSISMWADLMRRKGSILQRGLTVEQGDIIG